MGGVETDPLKTDHRLTGLHETLIHRRTDTKTTQPKSIQLIPSKPHKLHEFKRTCINNNQPFTHAPQSQNRMIKFRKVQKCAKTTAPMATVFVLGTRNLLPPRVTAAMQIISRRCCRCCFPLSQTEIEGNGLRPAEAGLALAFYCTIT